MSSQAFRLSLFNDLRHCFILFFNTLSFIIFLRSTSMLHKKKVFLIFAKCLPHGKFNSGHLVKSNFLALIRYLRRYSEKTIKRAAHGSYFASNRKSLACIVVKTQGSYCASDNVSVGKCSNFLGIFFLISTFLGSAASTFQHSNIPCRNVVMGSQLTIRFRSGFVRDSPNGDSSWESRRIPI